MNNIWLCICVQLLAGAKVNELTKHRQTALHLAAQQDQATICSVLLENGIDFAAEDENGNNGNYLFIFSSNFLVKDDGSLSSLKSKYFSF